MEVQTGYVITLLTTLLAGGMLVVLVENLHISSTLTDRFYNKMQPFMHKLTCYVRFVDRFKNGIKYIDPSQEYVAKLQSTINQIEKLATAYIISGKDLVMSQFSADSLDKFCESVINNVWYLLSEKYNMVIPYISYDNVSNSHNEKIIRKEIAGIKSEYDNETIDLPLLEMVSGEFFTDIYMPINQVFYEFEYWEKMSKRIIHHSVIAIAFTLCSIIAIICLGIHVCFCFNIVVCIMCSGLYLVILFEIINMYKKGNRLLQ